MKKIEAKIINTGTWFKVAIVELEEGSSQYLKNGVWVSGNVETFETEILTFGKYFDIIDDAEKFLKSKLFKGIFKQITKQGA